MAKSKFNRRTSDAVISETLKDIHARLKSGQNVSKRELKDILSVSVDSSLRAELDEPGAYHRFYNQAETKTPLLQIGDFI